MFKVIVKALIFSLVVNFLGYVLRIFFKTDSFLSDVGGINNFVSLFGTLYGIMAAFIVFEVWGEYNSTTKLIDEEALGLERLYQLILYFRDKALSQAMKKNIIKYIDLVINKEFIDLRRGARNKESSKVFREIFSIINNIKFDDSHDQIVFDHVIDHYGSLGKMRTERINQSLTRLPGLLKFFFYLTSFFALLIFIFMPFSNMYYGFLTTGMLAVVLALVTQLVEDLDNPFVGYWNISPEGFERARDHIEQDY